MDFASNQRWRCHNKQCLISWSEPFHCQGDQRCISHKKIWEYFDIPFISIASEPKNPASVFERPMKNNIHERKKVSSKSVMPCYKYADKSNDSDYPDLTSDSGEDSDESDVDFATRLILEYGVATVPFSAFQHEKTKNQLIRICFAKPDDVLEKAAKKLKGVTARVLS